MHKNTGAAWAAWAIKNSVIVLCFTALAIYFEKWWIVLFATFFLSSLKTTTEKTYTCHCDYCGRKLPVSGTLEEIEKAKQEAGWKRRKNGDKWEDICPECQMKEGYCE